MSTRRKNMALPGGLPVNLFSGYPYEVLERMVSIALKQEDWLHRIGKDVVDKDEVLARVEALESASRNYPHSRDALDLLFKRMRIYAENEEAPYHVTGRVIAYYAELINRLDRIDWNNHDFDIFSPVDELLIYMNYNSKTYIKSLCDWLTKRITETDDQVEMLQKLQFYRKAFAQLPQKPNIALKDNYHDLEEVMDDWFSHENEYLHSKLKLSAIQIGDDSGTEPKKTVPASKKEKERIRWALSADQIALILRAADESRVIIAKSLNSVFHTVIPYVSTAHRDELSASAVRSRAYNPEQTDKDAAIGALRKMISKIEGF